MTLTLSMCCGALGLVRVASVAMGVHSHALVVQYGIVICNSGFMQCSVVLMFPGILLQLQCHRRSRIFTMHVSSKALPQAALNETY